MRFTLADAYDTFKQRDFEKAEMMFKQIACTYPESSHAFFFLGSMALERGDNAQAIAWLESAAQRATEGQILNNLGTAFRRENQMKKAMEIYHQALEVDPDNPDYLNNMGTLYINEGNPLDGERYLRKAIEINPTHVHAHWNLSLILLESKRFLDGWKEYRWGLQSRDRMNRWATWPRWEGQIGRALIYGEQGLGDEIMFSSMYPDAIDVGAEIYVECHFRLQQVFERSFPGALFFPTREQRIVKTLPDFDYVLPCGGLGELFRPDEASFPQEALLKAGR